jgi:uncharacterized RDD family membrane protein YckC
METAQHLKIAPLQKRIGAAFLDTLIMVVLFFVMVTFFGTKTGSATNHTNTYQVALVGFPFLLYLMLILAYFTVLEWRFGMTVGKRLLGIRVVDYSGKKISFRQAFTRNILRILDGMPYLVPYIVGLVVVLTSQNRMRIGDLAAKTIVSQ